MTLSIFSFVAKIGIKSKGGYKPDNVPIDEELARMYDENFSMKIFFTWSKNSAEK